MNWETFDIPGSQPAVQLVRLSEVKEAKIRNLLVRFPPGWARPDAGYYEASEDFLVLEGDFEMSGIEFKPGDFAAVAAGGVRGPSLSKGGALVVAWFTGSIRWTSSPGAEFGQIEHWNWKDLGAAANSPADA